MFVNYKIKKKIKAIRLLTEICNRYGIKSPVRDGLLDELEAALEKKDYDAILDLYEELYRTTED